MISKELQFLNVLQTSPLSRHAKSSTLWSYRHWLTKQDVNTLNLRQELEVVTKAAEIHPHNYYAWYYFRRKLSECDAQDEGEIRDILLAVERWCFSHAMDISGWTFWVQLIVSDQHNIPPAEIDRIVHDVTEYCCILNVEKESIGAFLRLLFLQLPRIAETINNSRNIYSNGPHPPGQLDEALKWVIKLHRDLS